MTRHTYRRGPAGAVYYPMDGARQRDPLEPEDVCAALDAWAGNKPERHYPNDPEMVKHGHGIPGRGHTVYVGEPKPAPVPELPEWVTHSSVAESWLVPLHCGVEFWIGDRFDPDDLERIAEACTKLAARERARRAGS